MGVTRLLLLGQFYTIHMQFYVLLCTRLYVVKFVLVEITMQSQIWIVRLFPGPKNCTKQGPPVLEGWRLLYIFENPGLLCAAAVACHSPQRPQSYPQLSQASLRLKIYFEVCEPFHGSQPSVCHHGPAAAARRCRAAPLTVDVRPRVAIAASKLSSAQSSFSEAAPTRYYY